jgi:hypothetical protein
VDSAYRRCDLRVMVVDTSSAVRVPNECEEFGRRGRPAQTSAVYGAWFPKRRSGSFAVGEDSLIARHFPLDKRDRIG